MIGSADILIVAVGKPNLIRPHMVKNGAVVVDVGTNEIKENGITRIVGDVDYTGLLPTVSYITPVPSGVGPVATAVLMQNTLQGLYLPYKIKQPQFAH